MSLIIFEEQTQREIQDSSRIAIAHRLRRRMTRDDVPSVTETEQIHSAELENSAQAGRRELEPSLSETGQPDEGTVVEPLRGVFFLT